MLSRRDFNKLILSSLFFPSLAGCNTSLKKNFESGVLRLNLGNEPDTLDWSKATDSYSFDVISSLMVGLTKYNNDLISVPALAKSWKISNDEKIYTFFLDPEARWSDGKSILAEDFFYAWERLLNPHTAAPYAFLMYPIKNAKAYNEGSITNTNMLGIRVLDDHTLEVELESPLAFFLSLTSWAVYFPHRKDIIEKYGDDWTEPGKIVSCGPFILDKWQHEYKITLTKNPEYKHPAPLLEKIKFYIVPEQASAFSLYLNNEIDSIDNRSIPISEIETVKKMKETRFYPLLRGTYIGFNMKKPPFDNKLVRAAFSHALDRNIFPKILHRGEIPTTSWIPPGLKDFYSPDIGCAFNPELARDYLNRAGYENGKGFPEVTMFFPTREDAKLIAEASQEFWKKVLGIKINIVNMEWKVFLNTLQKNPPELFRLTWGADFPDPDTFMTVFLSNSGNNYTGLRNGLYDRIVFKAARTLDLEKRKKLYIKAQKILLENEIAIAPIFFNTQTILNKPWVKNFEFNPMDLVFFNKVNISD